MEKTTAATKMTVFFKFMVRYQPNCGGDEFSDRLERICRTDFSKNFFGSQRGTPSFWIENVSRNGFDRHLRENSPLRLTTDLFKGKVVPRARIELATQGFSGLCSTNWAISATKTSYPIFKFWRPILYNGFGIVNSRNCEEYDLKIIHSPGSWS